ncbi:hypothetical protein VKT23_012085 [Stygiomarasmius scandens]|uniref:Uncharacterized protein n=1 Tax=Marasmiellus scandens TaxID=2682957 RepID=A0ABR1J6W9_9AGAR
MNKPGIELGFTSPSTKPKPWWEFWEETEHLRFYQGNAMLTREDRIYEATMDFNKDRKWPPQQTQVRAMWDRFQVYIGTLTNAAGDEHIKLKNFVDNPGKVIQTYLSSFMSKSGSQGSEYRIGIIPRLLGFYINFLLRNHVLPDAQREDSLKHALNIIERAKVELPLIIQSARTLPDEWNLACRECFLRKADATDIFASINTPGDTPDTTVKKEEVEIKVEDAAPSSSTGGWGNSTGSWGLSNTEESGVKPETNTGWGSACGSAGGWGTSIDNTTSADSDAWASSASTWGSWDEQSSQTQEEAESKWTPPEPPSLQKFLGPTTFTFTHSAGIAEWSVRRIKSIQPPATGASDTNDITETTSAAVAVERAIESRLWKVVLTPWPTAEWSELKFEESLQNDAPRVLKSSIGKVVLSDGMVVEDGADVEIYTGPLRPHDPLHDDITVFIEEDSVKSILTGMALGGTWVQLLRNEDMEENSEGVLKTTDEGPFESRFWFMENLLRTMTSYHTV